MTREPGPAEGSKPIDTLRITEKEWHARIAEMESKQTPTTGHEKRKSQRHHHCVLATITIRTQNQGVTENYFLIRTRNISEGGMGFLHGAFVYPGSQVVAILQDNNGKAIALEGDVARCNHVAGKVHEVGVRFKRMIRVEDFIKPAAPESPRA